MIRFSYEVAETFPKSYVALTRAIKPYKLIMAFAAFENDLTLSYVSKAASFFSAFYNMER